MKNEDVRTQLYDGYDVQILKYDYMNEDFYALFVLPFNEITLGEYIQNLSFTKLNEYISKMNLQFIDVIIPKFKVNSKIDLSTPLKEMGLSRLFEFNHDLKGITNSPLAVSKIIQNVSVTVDESGAKAVVGTSGQIIAGSSFFTKELKLDRPFLFLIYEKGSDIPLFCSEINDPQF